MIWQCQQPERRISIAEWLRLDCTDRVTLVENRPKDLQWHISSPRKVPKIANQMIFIKMLDGKRNFKANQTSITLISLIQSLTISLKMGIVFCIISKTG